MLRATIRLRNGEQRDVYCRGLTVGSSTEPPILIIAGKVNSYGVTEGGPETIPLDRVKDVSFKEVL